MTAGHGERQAESLPATTVLILIDLQQGFADPVWGARNNPQAEANALRLLQAWRAQGMTMAHVQHRSTFPTSPLRPGQPGVEFLPDLAPLPGERVFPKSVNSAFIGTDLESFLRERGASRVVIVGLTTNHCVETTTRMAGNLGFRPLLVDDATATFDRTGPDGRHWAAATIHAMTMANLHDEFAEIVSTDAVLARLR